MRWPGVDGMDAQRGNVADGSRRLRLQSNRWVAHPHSAACSRHPVHENGDPEGREWSGRIKRGEIDTTAEEGERGS
jgi:hypothetical protein